MAIFGIVVENENKKIKEFIKEVKERLGTTNLAKNPFTGGVTSFVSLKRVKGETRVEQGYTIKLSPIYPNYAFFGAMCLTIACVFWPRVWLMFVTAFFYVISLFWSGRFYYFMLKLGLKKKGYKGSIRYLKPAEILEEVYFNGNK